MGKKLNYYAPNSRHEIGPDLELKLAAPGSFRLFVEGVQALGSYERTSVADYLKAALASLTECVRKYPADLLPRFYLGIAQSLRGYEGLEAATENLGYVINGGSRALSLSARYNLAATYVEFYNDPSFDQAEHLLVEMLEERDGVHDDDPLMFQAQALLLYVRIHRDLSEPAKNGASFDDLQPIAKTLAESLSAFEKRFMQSRSSKLKGADETWADFWNDRGMFHNALGRLFKDDRDQAQQSARDAIQAFKRALEVKPNWPPVRANLAVVYSELLGDETSVALAEQIFADLSRGSSQQHYAHYKLGRLAERRTQWAEAIEHYHKAVWIPGAAFAAARVLEKELGNSPAALSLLRDFGKNYPKEATTRRFVEELKRLEAMQ